MTAEPDLTLCIDGHKLTRRATDGPFLVGRDPLVAALAIDHPSVSRLHLWLHPGPQWTLVDYESRNGIYLAGRRVTRDVHITDGLTVHLAAPDGIALTFHYTATCHCATPTPAGHTRQPTADVTHNAYDVLHGADRGT